MSEGSFIEIVALPTEGEEQAAVQEKAETDNLAPLPPPAAVVLPGPLSKFTLVPTWEHSLQAPINLIQGENIIGRKQAKDSGADRVPLASVSKRAVSLVTPTLTDGDADDSRATLSIAALGLNPVHLYRHSQQGSSSSVTLAKNSEPSVISVGDRFSLSGSFYVFELVHPDVPRLHAPPAAPAIQPTSEVVAITATEAPAAPHDSTGVLLPLANNNQDELPAAATQIPEETQLQRAATILSEHSAGQSSRASSTGSGAGSVGDSTGMLFTWGTVGTVGLLSANDSSDMSSVSGPSSRVPSFEGVAELRPQLAPAQTVVMPASSRPPVPDESMGEDDIIDAENDNGGDAPDEGATVAQRRPKRKRKELNFADSAFGLVQAALLEDENDPDDYSQKMINKKKTRKPAKEKKAAKQAAAAPTATAAADQPPPTKKAKKKENKEGDNEDADDGLVMPKKSAHRQLKERLLFGEVLALYDSHHFNPSKKLAIFWHEDCILHRVPRWHLEKPQRLIVVIEAIKLFQEKFPAVVDIHESDIEPCSKEIILLVHDPAYIEKMEARAAALKPNEVPRHATLVSGNLALYEDMKDVPRDTYMSAGSWHAARLSAGAVCKAIDYVCAPGESRRSRNAFAAVRPPGHHAGVDGHAHANTQGYCIINNVAIGAKYAMRKYGITRVAIVDFDIHAGNGTSDCVDDEPGILFISLHCEDIYPFDADHPPSLLDTADNIHNLGFEVGASRSQYQRLFDAKTIPLIEQQKPQLIMVSAGFDAHEEDQTNACSLNYKDYIYITSQLKRLADIYAEGRLVSVLEGGYNLTALKQSVLAHVCELARV